MRTLSVTPFPDHPTIDCPEDVGSLVRAVRTAAGMTLEETALTVQVAKQTLQNLEKGTGTVSLALAFKVLTGLGIRLRWQALEGTSPVTTNKDVPSAS
jgi:DNA-binding XRE family transcriptional regulator